MFIGLFSWSMITICATMLMFQIQIVQYSTIHLFQRNIINYNLISHHFQSQPEIDVVVLVVAIFYSSYAFGIVFISCEVGQRLCDAFEDINDTIELLDHYRFSMKIKRMLPTIMITAQETVFIECFGSITCVRESFKKVSQSRSEMALCILPQILCLAL